MDESVSYLNEVSRLSAEVERLREENKRLREAALNALNRTGDRRTVAWRYLRELVSERKG